MTALEAAQRVCERVNAKKRPRLKIVCLCRGGNTRSVAMKMILNRYLNHSTIACGAENNDDDTRRMLFEWADSIAVMEVSLMDGVMPDLMHKAVLFDVGNDVWGNPFHEELQLKIASLLNANPIYSFGRVINPETVLRRLAAYRDKLHSRLEPMAV